MLKSQLDAMMEQIYNAPNPNPDTLLVSGKVYASMQAALRFEGRDRRRIKREMNKAWRAERKKELTNPRKPVFSMVEFWRNPSTAKPISEPT